MAEENENPIGISAGTTHIYITPSLKLTSFFWELQFYLTTMIKISGDGYIFFRKPSFWILLVCCSNLRVLVNAKAIHVVEQVVVFCP